MKSKYRGKVTRTSGWQSQHLYDLELSNFHVSDLVALNHYYVKNIRDFPNHFDLKDELYQKEYQSILQRKAMIGEELNNRMRDIIASPSYQERHSYFDPETGLVIDKYGTIKYSISYTDNEESITYNNNIYIAFEEPSDRKDNTIYYKYHTKKGIYENWEYVKSMKD